MKVSKIFEMQSGPRSFYIHSKNENIVGKQIHTDKSEGNKELIKFKH